MGHFVAFWGNLGHFGSFWGIASRWGPRGGPPLIPTPQHPPPKPKALPRGGKSKSQGFVESGPIASPDPRPDPRCRMYEMYHSQDNTDSVRSL